MKGCARISLVGIGLSLVLGGCVGLRITQGPSFAPAPTEGSRSPSVNGDPNPAKNHGQARKEEVQTRNDERKAVKEEAKDEKKEEKKGKKDKNDKND